MPLTAIYPGTFDPLTKGHSDIILRASHFVDKLIIGVAHNVSKNPIFNLEERVELIEQEVQILKKKDSNLKVEVMPFKNLLVNFAQDVGANVLIRGLRNPTDYEYESQMAALNARLNPEIETVCLMSRHEVQIISSNFVKEICKFGGDIEQFLSPHVAKKLKEKIEEDLI